MLGTLKIFAILTVATGGIGYGLYSQTNLFENGCPFSSKKCCTTTPTEPTATDLSAAADAPSCCAAVKPCCDLTEACVAPLPSVVKITPATSCCDSHTSSIAIAPMPTVKITKLGCCCELPAAVVADHVAPAPRLAASK